jgi:hypothetical protein
MVPSKNEMTVSHGRGNMSSSQQQYEEPTRGKAPRMARKKKRSYGAGCVMRVKTGLAIRWRERIDCDGTFKKVLRYKALGKVSLHDATEELRKHLAAAAEPKQKPLTFSELAASWESNVLPHYPKHSTRN